jgi:large subunit ribosomal protein L31
MKRSEMNAMIQPELTLATFTCVTCGTEITTRTAGAGQRLDVCSNCHPAYTGRERATATGSRIERFERRLANARG